MAWTAPRTWIASEVVTAAIMNQHVRDNLLALQDRIQVIRKPLDETVTSSTALQNDDDLKFTAVAGQTYVFSLALCVGCGAAGVDLKSGFSFPAGTMMFGIDGQDLAATTNTSAAVITSNNAAVSATTAFSVGAIAGNTFVLINGTFVASGGGTVNYMFAQDTSSASGIVVKAGSNLTAIRVAA